MINPVSNSVYNQNAFRDFPPKSNENFFITQKPQEDTVKKPSHKKRNLAYAIGSTALLVGVGILTLTRGLPKNTIKYLENIRGFLEKRLERSNIKGSDKWSEFYNYSLRKVNVFMEKAQSINHINSLKDTLFKSLMDKSKFTAKIHRKITTAFERVSRSTVKSAYKDTGKKFTKMFGAFEKLDTRILASNPEKIITINGIARTKRDWIEIAQKHRQNIQGAVEEFISQPQQMNRYRRIKSVTSKLYDQFWDESFKGFWSKDNKFLRKEMWQTFIPEEKIAAGKMSLADQVAAVRNKITYTNADKIEIMSGQLKKLEELVLPSDKEGLSLIKKLKWLLKNPDGLAENSDVIKRELAKVMQRPLQTGLDRSILANQQNLRQSYMKAIIDLMESKNSGELQEMLAIYEKIAPYELSVIKPQVTKAVKSFDSSLETETVKFYDKLRDMALGSAPTDLVSPIVSLGMISYGLTKANDNDERMSVVLKAGIPIIGGLCTSLFCTARLVAGIKGMAIAGVSGVILNRIGSFVDNMRKKSSKNPTNGQVA